MLSSNFWKSRFAGDTSVIGRWVTWNSRQFQIVGVAQEGFSGGSPGAATDLWLPLKTFGNARQMADPKRDMLNVMGRSKDGVTLTSQEAVLQVVFTNFRKEFGLDQRRLSLRAAHATDSPPDSLLGHRCFCPTGRPSSY